MTLFLAGHETTAFALAWTIDLLGCNPEARARLEAEVDAALGGRAPDASDADRLPYARRVLAEGMRLYPPAWTLARQAVEDVALGGFVLPAGGTAMLPQWVIHRDPRH